MKGGPWQAGSVRGRLAMVAVLGVLLCGGAAGVSAALSGRPDYDRNGVVTTSDLFEFARAYRARKSGAAQSRAADLNGDGNVNELDIFRFLRRWNEDRERSLTEGIP